MKSKNLLLVFIIAAAISYHLLLSTGCATRHYCQPSPRSKDWAAGNLIKTQRTVRGIVHHFQMADGSIKTKTFQDKLIVGECYLIDTLHDCKTLKATS